MLLLCYAHAYVATALAGIDFVMSTITHEFNAGDGGGYLRCLDVMILGGEVGLEEDKVFMVSLTTNGSNSVVLGNAITEIIIHDGMKHPLHVCLSVFITSVDNLVFFNETINNTVEEGGNITVCAEIQLLPTFMRNLRVVLATVDVTGIIQINNTTHQVICLFGLCSNTV